MAEARAAYRLFDEEDVTHDAIVAVRLLQFCANARVNPDSPVAEAERTIEVLALALDCPVDVLRSNRGFARGVASLGGFRGCKGDGEPGWQTIHRGKG